MGAPIPLEIRLMNRIEFRDEYECWPWQGAINKDSGYGVIAVGRKMLYVHRVAHELFVGPIPSGFHVDHVAANGCTIRHCVNYLHHLEAVLQKENARRARKTHCYRGHLLDDANVWVSPDGKLRQCRKCNCARQAKQRAARK